MAKKRIFDLPETKGTFHVIGQATRLNSDKAYQNSKTANGKFYKSINFGIRYKENEPSVSVSLTGYQNDEVYFWSSKDKQSKRVPWKDRNSFKEDGYVMMGKSLSVERDEHGDPLPYQILTDFDAVEKIHWKLNDDEFIYAAGDVVYRPYTNKDGEKRTSITMTPSRIYLQKPGFNWESLTDDKAGFIFKQRFVYTEIEQEVDDDDKPTGRYIVHGKVVTYSSIESVSFILENKQVAVNLKKKVDPYTAMDVYGLVKMKTFEEEVVVEDDGWGDQTFAKKITAPSKREFVIIRVDKDSFDSETYTKEEIKKAIDAVRANEEVEETYAAKKDPKENDAWSTEIDDSEDDDWGSEDLPF